MQRTLLIKITLHPLYETEWLMTRQSKFTHVLQPTFILPFLTTGRQYLSNRHFGQHPHHGSNQPYKRL